MANIAHQFLTALKRPRWRWALVIALLSDAVGFGVVLVPPLQWLLDAVTAVLLLAVLGFRWPLLSTLAIEVVPGLQLFPFWTVVVAVLAGTERRGLPHGAEAVEGVPDQIEPKE